jgi:hypothetical protein
MHAQTLLIIRRLRWRGGAILLAMIVTAIGVAGLPGKALSWLTPPKGSSLLNSVRSIDHSTTPRGHTIRAAQAVTKPSPTLLATEVVTLSPKGFEPSEITRPADKFFLLISNQSGLRSVNLQLNRLRGARLIEKELPVGKNDWRNVVDLPAGQYVISEANHPEWTCAITLTNK